jgi:hemerythrin-like metal-binding protein
MNIPWNPSYRIGDTRIDQQHEQLFALANAMLQTTTHEALQLHAIQLYKAVRKHFFEEEALMRETKFPGLEGHVASHNAILAKLVGLSADIGKNHVSVALVEDFLNEWGMRHIPNEDAAFTKHINTFANTPFQEDQ